VIRGVDLGGSGVEVRPGPGRTVLYFLTSSCESCERVWEQLGAGMPGVAVTPDPATENRRRLRRLAAPGTTVVMSTGAWLEYVSGPAPWRVVIEDGEVVSADTWPFGPRPGPTPGG